MNGLELVQASAAGHELSTRPREVLGLPPGFPDPELASWGMVNEVLNLGRTYLEFLAPSAPSSPLHRFLARGAGGYVVAVRVPDTDALVERASRRGVRVVHRQEFHGAEIVQLHPADLGVMLEADLLPDGRHWHYDTWDVPERPSDAPGGDLVAVDIAVDSPEETASLWAHLLDAPPASATSVQVGSGLVRFVPSAGRTGLIAVDLRSAQAAEHVLSGLVVRLVPVSEEGA
ncbi:VOC family protein [Actinocorallia populi]|uniref:VOC family protein n=1 Tax=Actinocorallia populi TaxID=2079200 RepID=UPI000D08B398|nr:VOC family protein [Actinocorallia populi]